MEAALPYPARAGLVSHGRTVLALLVAVALLTGGCGGGSRARRGSGPLPSGSATTKARGFHQRGFASYYSNRLAGNRTASGDRYRPQEMTAAHRTLPFGTVVRVTRVGESGEADGPSVVVRINDRGPFGGNDRIIDLSFAAARALGILRVGVVMVEVMATPAPPP